MHNTILQRKTNYSTSRLTSPPLYFSIFAKGTNIRKINRWLSYIVLLCFPNNNSPKILHHIPLAFLKIYSCCIVPQNKTIDMQT